MCWAADGNGCAPLYLTGIWNLQVVPTGDGYLIRMFCFRWHNNIETSEIASLFGHIVGIGTLFPVCDRCGAADVRRTGYIHLKLRRKRICCGISP